LRRFPEHCSHWFNLTKSEAIVVYKLIVNGMTIEYPDDMTIAISGLTIRLLHEKSAAAPEAAPHQAIAPREDPTPPKAAAPQKKPPTPKRPPQIQQLPTNWKQVVIETLRAYDGSAYARMLSSRVFQGHGKMTYSGTTKLRNELRAMVKRGELLALGTNSDRASAQMLYGLPDTEQEPVMQTTRSSNAMAS
jgi:hypothetical protein